MKMLWLLWLFLLLLPVSSHAACTGASPTWTCTGDVASLSALFNNTPVLIQEGDTINVSAGTFVWTTPLIIGEGKAIPGFTFAGAGQGVTIFQRTSGTFTESSPTGFFVAEQLATSGLTRFTAFTIDVNSMTSPSACILCMFGSGLDRFRIDHVTLDHVKTARGFAVLGNRSATGGLEYTGLIDHTKCTTAAGPSVQCYVVRGSWDSANQKQYLFTPQPGTNHATYVEDSECEYLGVVDDCTDGTMGENYVFRYNTSNFAIGVHGADSLVRGVHLMEVYRNKFTDTTVNHYAANWRTGPNFMFDNVYTNGVHTYGTINFTLYRTLDSFTTPGKCDGSSAYDRNLGTGTPAVDGVAPTGNPGWGCLDQTGWYFPGIAPNGAAGVLTPAYFWNNTIGGVNAVYANNDGPAGAGCTLPNCGVYSTNYIVSDRDYYKGGIVAQTSSSSPFNGTSGVGWGTLARRPATCTTGVGYWATDQGSWNTSLTDAAFNPRGIAGESGLFYTCTATDTWTLYYTPYTYPHPLQGSAPAIPTAPTALRVIGTSTGTTCTVTWAESGMAGLVGYHLYSGTATGNYNRPVINKTAALSATAHQPPRQHTFQFPVAGTYYIAVTSYSDSVADSAASSEVTCVSTGLSRTAAGARTSRSPNP